MEYQSPGGLEALAKFLFVFVVMLPFHGAFYYTYWKGNMSKRRLWIPNIKETAKKSSHRYSKYKRNQGRDRKVEKEMIQLIRKSY